MPEFVVNGIQNMSKSILNLFTLNRSVSSLIFSSKNPIAFFRLYDPKFSEPHFLPLSFRDNTVFSWPQALKQSIILIPQHTATEKNPIIREELRKKEEIARSHRSFEKASHLIELASLYLESSRTESAEKLIESAISLLLLEDSLENIQTISHAHQLMGVSKQLKHDYIGAITHYKQALDCSAKIFQGFKHPSQAQFYAQLGMAYGAANQLTEFENCYKKIIDNMSTCFYDSPSMWIDFASALALIYQKQGKNDQAIFWHERCYRSYSQRPNKIYASIERINWAATLIMQNEFFQAKDYLVEAKKILEKQPLLHRTFQKVIDFNTQMCQENIPEVRPTIP